jgi:hypothetical protein
MQITLLLLHDSEYTENEGNSMLQTKARDEPTFQNTLPSIGVSISRRIEDVEKRQKPANDVKKLRQHI